MRAKNTFTIHTELIDGTLSGARNIYMGANSTCHLYVIPREDINIANNIADIAGQPAFYILLGDAFILKATLMAEWTTEKEFDRPSTAPDNDTVNVPVNDTIKLLQLTERQRKIYEIIKSGTVNNMVNDTINDTTNDTINAQTLSDALGTSVITVKRDLYVLRDLNLIRYVGSNKKGHWEIANKE